MTIAKAIARAWKNRVYRDKLLEDTHGALTDEKVAIRAGLTVKVVENTADTLHFVLPAAPANAGELSSDQLERAAVLSTGGRGVVALFRGTDGYGLVGGDSTGGAFLGSEMGTFLGGSSGVDGGFLGGENGGFIGNDPV